MKAINVPPHYLMKKPGPMLSMKSRVSSEAMMRTQEYALAYSAFRTNDPGASAN